MDEITAALVHQRAIQVIVVSQDQGVRQEAIHSIQLLAVAAGMNIYVYTSLYMSRNKVEPRLGTYI